MHLNHICYPHMPIGRMWTYRLLLVCNCVCCVALSSCIVYLSMHRPIINLSNKQKFFILRILFFSFNYNDLITFSKQVMDIK